MVRQHVKPNDGLRSSIPDRGWQVSIGRESDGMENEFKCLSSVSGRYQTLVLCERYDVTRFMKIKIQFSRLGDLQIDQISMRKRQNNKSSIKSIPAASPRSRI